MVEVYSSLWGQCICFKGIIQRLYFQHMDKIKFYVVRPFLALLLGCIDLNLQVDASKVESFAEFKDVPKPVFLMYKDGQRVEAVEGLFLVPLQSCLWFSQVSMDLRLSVL